MTEHLLKTWTGFFDGLLDGSKTAEVRYNDRRFGVGDLLVLNEFDQYRQRYTGRVEHRIVSRIDDLGSITDASGFVLLSFESAAPDTDRPDGPYLCVDRECSGHANSPLSPRYLRGDR